MTDKELIKKEIERLITIEEETSHLDKVSFNSGRWKALTQLKIFIDSLPEESGCEVNFTTKSEDLEEAADKYAKEQYPWQNGYEKWELPIRDFIAGAEWQKEQMKDALKTEYEKGRFDMRKEMMKALVNSEIVKDIHNQLSVKSEPLNDTFRDIKFGDKVKIIIVKTEQQ